MKSLIFLSPFLLLACGSANTNTGTKDTVVIIQTTPVPLPEKIKTDNAEKKSASDEPITIDSFTSAPIDIDYNRNFTGNYEVVLEILESDCADHQVGNSRPETWKISVTDGTYKMRVISDSKTINNYSGYQNNGELVLVGNHETLLGIKSKATVTLQFDGEKLFGSRVLKTVDSNGEPCSLTQAVTTNQ